MGRAAPRSARLVLGLSPKWRSLSLGTRYNPRRRPTQVGTHNKYLLTAELGGKICAAAVLTANEEGRHSRGGESPPPRLVTVLAT